MRGLLVNSPAYIVIIEEKTQQPRFLALEGVELIYAHANSSNWRVPWEICHLYRTDFNLFSGCSARNVSNLGRSSHWLSKCHRRQSLLSSQTPEYLRQC